jgi:hypothetical protein
MQNPEIAPALQALGFQSDSSPAEEAFAVKFGFDALVYPNPVLATEGVLQLELSLLKKQKLTAQISNLEGRVLQVLFKNRDLNTGIFQEEYQISNLNKGVYLLEIRNEAGGVWVQKIVAE